MFDLSNYSTKSKYNENSNKLSMGKVKGETSGVAIEEKWRQTKKKKEEECCCNNTENIKNIKMYSSVINV